MITASGKRRRRHLSKQALERILRYSWTHEWRPDPTVTFHVANPNGQQDPGPAARK